MMITIYIRYFELYYENYLPSLNHSDSSLFYGRKVAVLFNGFFIAGTTQGGQQSNYGFFD